MKILITEKQKNYLLKKKLNEDISRVELLPNGKIKFNNSNELIYGLKVLGELRKIKTLTPTENKTYKITADMGLLLGKVVKEIPPDVVIKISNEIGKSNEIELGGVPPKTLVRQKV